MGNVLNTVTASLGYSGFGVRDREDLLDKIDNGFEAVNEFAGLVTGSFSLTFKTSGSSAGLLGQNAGVIGAAYTREDNVIREVVAWAASSGSGGVTRIDVDIQQGVAGNFSSIFSNSAFKPAVSSSLGNYGIARSASFVSGSDMVWRAGTLIRAQLETAAGVEAASAQSGLTVQVFYTPSGSYGA